jgi:hypothetical protein
MKINLDDLRALVAKETRRALVETIDPELGTKEKKRQDKMAKSVDDLGVKAEQDSEDIKEQEGDEDEETGVPETIDDDSEDAAKRKDRTGGKGTEDSPKLDTPGEKQLQAPTVGAVIDKLNALRGGKSLKDPEVKKSFSQYFKNLTKTERTSLLAFLTGMSQILAGVSSGAEALDPSDLGITVNTSKKDTSQSKEDSVKPQGKQSGNQDKPIVVGEGRKAVRKNKLYSYKVRK